MPTIAGAVLEIARYRAVQGTITADAEAYYSEATWNNAGVTFTHVKSNVTDTASNAASLLVDRQVGGASKWKLDKTGATTQAGALTVSAGGITVTGNSTITGTLGGITGLTVAGNITLSGASRNIIQGTTNFSIRNNANNADNLLITDAGAITVRSTISGVTTLTATTLAGTLSTAAQPNVTSLGTLTSLTVNGTVLANTINSLGTLEVQATAGPQASVKYDGSNTFTITVSSAGATTIGGVGASAGVSFSNPLTASGTFFASSTSQFSGEVFVNSALLRTSASVAGGARFRLPHGSAPTSPVDGDIWTTTSGLFVRINGSTVGPLT